MSFDVAKFERTKFAPRTKDVEVPALADFFSDGEPRVWKVRGLDAVELFRATEAERRQSDIGALLQAAATNAEMVEALKRVVGVSKDTPGEIAKRMEMLVMGSVAPKIELTTAVHLSKSFPMEFLMLAATIAELSGLGCEAVKPGAASQPTTG